MACSKMANELQELSELQKLKEENKKFKDILFKGRFDFWVFEGLHEGGTINVCELNGNSIPIDVKHFTKISHIKKMYREKAAVPSEIDFRLCFGGSRGSAILEDHRTLFHYRIPVGATIHMLIETKKESHEIISENFDRLKEKFNDEFYIQHYEEKLKEKRELKMRFGGLSKSGKRAGWTGYQPTLETNKLLRAEEGLH